MVLMVAEFDMHTDDVAAAGVVGIVVVVDVVADVDDIVVEH